MKQIVACDVGMLGVTVVDAVANVFICGVVQVEAEGIAGVDAVVQRALFGVVPSGALAVEGSDEGFCAQGGRDVPIVMSCRWLWHVSVRIHLLVLRAISGRVHDFATCRAISLNARSVAFAFVSSAAFVVVSFVPVFVCAAFCSAA